VILREEPYRFNFFQAVRILERLRSDHARVGSDAETGDECVRFGSMLSLVFPPSDIAELRPPVDVGKPPQLVVAFMGLTGPSGALPRFYTELLIERARKKDRTLRDFFDLFNHRLISLFYAAWEKYRFWKCYERAERIGRQRRAESASRYRAFVTEMRPRLDPFGQCLLDLTGMGVASLRYQASERTQLRQRSSVTDSTIRYYAGLLANRHRSAVGLEGLLEDYVGIPTQVVQFAGQWLPLEIGNQTRLVDDGNTRLGSDTVAGTRIWDRQSKFRIRLGPLTYEQFVQFLPSGNQHRQTADVSRLYAGPDWDMDLQLVLQAQEVPACQLDDSLDGPQLGWNTWIANSPFQHDVEDAILMLEG
jgi:type VI secretion system protein ImpH